MADEQFVKAPGMLLFQVPQAGADPPAVVERQYMPTPAVCSNLMAAVRGQVVGTNSAIAGINPTPETLHLGHQLTVPLRVDGHVLEDAGNRGPGGREYSELSLLTNL